MMIRSVQKTVKDAVLFTLADTVDSCRELHIMPPKKRVWVPDYNLAS